MDAQNEPNQTNIFKFTASGEVQIGYLGPDGVIYELRWGESHAIGLVDSEQHVLRKTRFDLRELGWFQVDGAVYSHGLLEGGQLGWVDAEGVVWQGGLILGEEEVGRAAGPQPAAAGAALLLLFLPDDQETTKRMQR